MSSKGCAQPVTGGAWRLNLALAHKKFFFLNIIIIILGTLNFTIFTGSKHRALFNFHIRQIDSLITNSHHGYHRHLHDVEGVKKSARHSPRSERLLAQAEGTALPVIYKTFLQIADYQWYGVPLVLQLRWYIGIFQSIDYLLHGSSRPRLSLQASPYQAAKHTVRYKHDLFFTLTRIWKFPDAHFTKKNTKAVHINLKAIIIQDITY